MTFKDILKAVAEKTESSQAKTREFYDALVEVVAEAIKELDPSDKDSKVVLNNLITFRTVLVPEREHRNPQNGSKIVKPAHKALKAKLPAGVKALVE